MCLFKHNTTKKVCFDTFLLQALDLSVSTLTALNERHKSSVRNLYVLTTTHNPSEGDEDKIYLCSFRESSPGHPYLIIRYIRELSWIICLCTPHACVSIYLYNYLVCRLQLAYSQYLSKSRGSLPIEQLN